MYQSFYQLQKAPFSLTPDPTMFFPGGPYEETLASLEYGLISKKAFILLTGEPGLGKTTLLRKIIREKNGGIKVGVIVNTTSTWSSVMPWVSLSFDLDVRSDTPSDHFLALSRFLQSAQREHPLLLIIDEAQNLTSSMLEELRLLSNLNVEDIPYLQIILSGQPQLRSLLQQPELIQFAQRIEVDCALGPLDREMTARYIHYRLNCVGGASTLFTQAACGLIYELSRGIPRLINQLCDLSLTYGFARHMLKISDQVVAEVAFGRLLGGILPIDHSTRIQSILSRNTPDPDLTDQPETIPEKPIAHNGLVNMAGRNGKPRPTEDTPAEVPVKPQAAQSQIDPHPVSPVLQSVPVVETADQAHRMLKQGIDLQKKHKYRLAIQVLSVAAQHAPTRGKAHREIGICFASAGKPQKAISHFQRALEWASDLSTNDEEILSIRYELGKALFAAGEKTRSFEQFQHIDTLQSGYRDVSKWLAKKPSSSSGSASTLVEPNLVTHSLWERLRHQFSLSAFKRSPKSKRGSARNEKI